MTASVLTRPLHVSNRALRAYLSGLEDTLAKAGARVAILSTRVVEVSGANVGIIETDARVGSCTYRQVMYLLPGSEHAAQIVLSATPDRFDRVSGVVQQVALHTGGIADHAFAPRFAAGVLLDNPGDRDFALGLITGAAIGIAGALWLIRRLRGDRSVAGV